MPLAEVVRLEKHRARDIQVAGPRQVVRRGDGFTPVADADRLMGGGTSTGDRPADPDSGVNVVVVSVAGAELGITVERIVDVVGAESPLQGELAATGVAGTVALGGQATEVLDLAAVAARA